MLNILIGISTNIDQNQRIYVATAKSTVVVRYSIAEINLPNTSERITVSNQIMNQMLLNLSGKRISWPSPFVKGIKRRY